MRDQAKVVIVGGGMMGVGLAYHLAEEGWTDVMLIEKGELTSGSTWHAAGQCPSFIGDYNMAKMHHYSNQLYPTLEEKTGQYAGWHGAGGLRLAVTQAEVDMFHQVAGFAPNVGFFMEIVTPERAKEINPFLNTDGVLAVAWTTDDGHVDPAGCCNAMAAGARQMGVTIVRRNRVLDIEQLPSGEWKVMTEQGDVTCEYVVNAAGCYAREVSDMMGTFAPITNMEHHYIVTEALPDFIARDEEMPVMRDPWASCYYRQEQKAGLIGIYEWEATEAWAETGGSPAWDSENELFNDALDRVLPYVEKVFQRVPIFGNAGIKRIVNGAIPHTPDGNPLLGPAAGLKNAWMCCGSSIGIAQGGGAGKYLAQWMVHGDSEINMASVDPRRFGRYADTDYTRDKSFQDYAHMYIQHLPGDERAAGRPARTSTLYEKLKGKGAVYTEAFGWERPKWFSLDGREEETGYRHNNVFEVVAEECRAVRERVGVLDLSSFAKFDVRGADAEAWLNQLFANKVPSKPGRIGLCHRLAENGRIQGESTITKLDEGWFHVCSGAAWEIRDGDAFEQALDEELDVQIGNTSDDIGILVVAGPKSRDVLAELTDADLSNDAFRWLTAQVIEVAGVQLAALRVNYVGSLGWELHAPMSKLPQIYDAVWKAGQAHGIADFGTYTLNSLRMEKAYKGIGAELTNEITPVEADIMRFVKLDKDFIGKASVERVLQAEPVTRICYGEVETEDTDVFGGEPVFDGDRVIGVTTSGGYGHSVGKSLFFAYVEPDFAEPGAAFSVELLGKKCAATVLADPAFDPANEVLRS
ncbi:MAG: FAD-dependent oxidoreductase [Pseudomonadota bacterium]